ncbi:hypothetical protein EK21DRAFT_111709 [Setomelanomma holmii]|uniref:Uncharacterized protein n=1 Tax=Setomelanomma holmii TaxID=210430 RepID=A0A9P4LNE7_9PLEO|nr:hypothetical protein EK21DRAFT_111709 [Setomelanomma holmii]
MNTAELRGLIYETTYKSNDLKAFTEFMNCCKTIQDENLTTLKRITQNALAAEQMNWSERYSAPLRVPADGPATLSELRTVELQLPLSKFSSTVSDQFQADPSRP